MLTDTQMNDYQMLPCTSCGMFKLCTLHELSIIQQQLTSSDYSPYTCPSCTENCLLHSRIKAQDDSIKDLNERISALINIHNLEKDVDTMSAQLSGANSQPLFNSSSHFDVDQFFTTSSTHHADNGTRSSFLDVTPVLSANTPLPTINGIIKSDVKDVVILSTNNSQNEASKEDKTSCTPCIIDVDGDGPQSKAIAAEYKEENTSKFKENTIVTNMIIGDESLRDVQYLKSDKLYPNSNEWFKVARKNASLQDLIDTVLHFGKFHKI